MTNPVPNTSAAAGYLTPTVEPVEGDAFDDFLQQIVVGITGMQGSLVRPRWQPTLPKMPEQSVSWCAIGVTSTDDLSVRGQMRHDPNAKIVADGDGSDHSIGWDRVTVLVSMYGPEAQANASMLANGLRVSQNREAMARAGVGLVSTGPRRQMSAVMPNQQVTRRIDMEIKLDRVVARTYQVYNLLSAQGAVHNRANGTNQNETTGFDTSVPAIPT